MISTKFRQKLIPKPNFHSTEAVCNLTSDNHERNPHAKVSSENTNTNNIKGKNVHFKSHIEMFFSAKFLDELQNTEVKRTSKFY